MDIARTIIAVENDFLCKLSVQNGFKDCTKVRQANAEAEFVKTRELRPGDAVKIPVVTPKEDTGQTELRHRFQRPGVPVAAIRFVHGSASTAVQNDKTLTFIDVSNYKTDQAGKGRKAAFVDHNVRGFNADADADPDTFKVEVFDFRAKVKDLPAEIDALRPVFKPDGKILRHEEFQGDRKAAGTEANKRSLDVTTTEQGTTHRFRSCYLRAVVDEFDKGEKGAGGRKLQTVLTSDMTESAQAADKAGKPADAADFRKVEILDQKLSARYFLKECPAAAGKAKCQARAVVEVGHAKRRVKAVVHVLRKSRDGAGVVTVDAARDWCQKYVRWLYAQANMGVKFLDPFVRLIQPPANMITIGTPTGPRANGGGEISVNIGIDGAAKKNAKISTSRNSKPITTANKLAEEIRKVFPALKVVVGENAINTGASRGSADILVGDPNAQLIEIDLVTNSDSKQKAAVVRITTTKIEEFNATHRSFVGTPDERILLRNYDTGKDRIDVFIVGDLSDGSFGEAFRPFKEEPANDPKAPIINSLIFRQGPIDGDIVHTTLPHEMAHVLADAGHIKVEDTEMSFSGSPVGNEEKVVHGPKRISDPSEPANHLEWLSGFKTKGSPVQFLRENNSGLLTDW
ncbi:MAG TPA: hypothetical protein VNT79_01140 [Phycisphaerae bacterium]|nr:hypothetical protein [Phycisphaerae bacterium]